MKTTIITPPPVQPPKVVTIELTEVEAHFLASMVKTHGYTLEYDKYGYDGFFGPRSPRFTHGELHEFMKAMHVFQSKFPPIYNLRFD